MERHEKELHFILLGFKASTMIVYSETIKLGHDMLNFIQLCQICMIEAWI